MIITDRTPVLTTSLDPGSEEYQADRADMTSRLDELAELVEIVHSAGTPAAVARHHAADKLLARERVDLVLDPHTPFLELSMFGGAHEPDEHPGGRIITGIGTVVGTECMIIANEPTVKGGSSNPATMNKQLRALRIARENRLPVVQLVESGGADLPKQAEIFVPGGQVFHDITSLSAAGIPTIAVVFGSSTAGGAYIPGMSQFTILVKNAATVFLGGPPLVKMAINEDIGAEELGGAVMHARESGLADYLAEDERDALRLARQVVADLAWHKAGPTPGPSPEPILDRQDLLACVPSDPKRSADPREIIGRIVDGSRFSEFKPEYGRSLVTGWATIGGHRVGILANDGILFSAESNKGAHFIQLANAKNVPLVFLQNITGFMVGSQAERGGIIKDGSKLINAVSNSTVPHLVLMVGASYGAGNYGMSGKAFGPRFVFTWPNHRIAVMGGPQLAGVMSIVRRGAAERRGELYDDQQDAELRRRTEEMIDAQSTALYATGRLWDDGIIDPRDSRTVLTLALSAVQSAPVDGATRFAPFRF
ncbi:acyl-CoA carboxylase subunit beta [Rhodococcus koreensis]